MLKIKQFILLFILFQSFTSFGQLTIESSSDYYLINFDQSLNGVNEGAFAGLGLLTSPTSGSLDADGWSVQGMSDGDQLFGMSATTGDFSRGLNNGNVSAGGLYAFEHTSNNVGIGIQPTGSDWTSGDIALKIVNNRAITINEIQLDYEIWSLNNADRANSFNFSYSLDNVNYMAVSSANFTSTAAADGSPTWQQLDRSIIITGIQIQTGQTIYFRWTGSDVSGSGSRDEFALDNIEVYAFPLTNNCVYPSSQAQNLTFSSVTSNTVTLQFDTATNADNYLIIACENVQLDSTPIDGVLYAPGMAFGNGTVVDFTTMTTIFSDGLQESTLYYFYVFSAQNNCINGPLYGQFPPLSDSISTVASTPNNYYDGIGNLTCEDLKTALHLLIDNHTSISYANLWTLYVTSDDHLNDAMTDTILWDMYSDNPVGSENEFFLVSDQCGIFMSEGDCYNREHTFPKSWWGGSESLDIYTDAFHVIPTDGYVNGIRSNHPYGIVQSGTETYIANNGSKAGSSLISIPGYSGLVFEPIDSYKGDIARNYFYLATRYEDQMLNWENISSSGDAILDGSSFETFEPWFLNLLMTWSQLDGVSQKEMDRNEEIYLVQGNRNPFIDHPEYVNLIWGGNCNGTLDTVAPTPVVLDSSGLTETEIFLFWTGSTDNIGITGYNLYRDSLLIYSGLDSGFLDLSLMPGTDYFYYVEVVDSAGNISFPNQRLDILTASTDSCIYVFPSTSFFETDFDIWNSSDTSTIRYNGINSIEGDFSLLVLGTNNSIYSDCINVSSENKIVLSFIYKAINFESTDAFMLEYFDGSSWLLLKNYEQGIWFDNDKISKIIYELPSIYYNLATNLRFRITNTSDEENDELYIDQMIIGID